ncbi:MAG: polysaccharide deacetylase family protein [Thermaerobacter sp.]|nr:polysaccharide deacetylase family protein [Thermaerobacter sp.]
MLWVELLLVVIVVYWVLPEIIWHYLHVGLVATPRVVGDFVCFTFDDGPGEATESVLSVLAANESQATFFLVGTQARRHPELVQRMIREGHEVASHGARHRSAWWMTPWGSFRQVSAAGAELSHLSGGEVRHFRPPWGQFNLFVPIAASAQRQRIALWSYDPGDWRKGQDPAALAQRIISRLQPGQIFLLHDAGGKDGRLHTAKALEIALPELRRLGYKAVTLEELLRHEMPISFGRRALQAVWGLWESAFEKMNHIERLGDVRSVLRIGRVTYRGIEAHLKNGRVVKPGDAVGEIHFNNPQLAALGALRALPLVDQAMRELTRVMVENPRYQKIDVFFGISVAFRGTRRFGFEVVDLDFPPLRKFLAGTYLRWVMTVYHPQGLERLNHRREQLEPKGVFITRDTLLQRYGSSSQVDGRK